MSTFAKQVVDLLEAREGQKIGTPGIVGLSSGETCRYSLVKAIRALRFGGAFSKFEAEASFERACSDAISKSLGVPQPGDGMLVPSEVLTRPIGAAAVRAMATTPGAKGGYLVNVENMGFIDILRARSVAMSLGARTLSGLRGNVEFGRQTGKVTISWQAGDGTSVSAADQALGQLSMTPKTAIALTDVSEQLLTQSDAAEGLIANDLASAIAIDGVDAAVINGAGGAQPLGILNTPGVAANQDAASATYAKILAFAQAAGGANAIRGNPGWVTNIAGSTALMQRQRFTSTDTPLWEGNQLDGTLVGFRAMSSEQIASGGLIFGSWDELLIGEWGILELRSDRGGTRFNQAQVGIRAMWMVDVLVRYPQAFVASASLS